MARAILKETMRQIIEQGDASMLVNTAQTFGKELKDDGLTKSQIRNIFGEVRRIEAEWRTSYNEQDKNKLNDVARKSFRSLLLLKPRMAYQKTRNRETSALMTELSNAIDLVASVKGETEVAKAEEQYKRFRYFTEFFEAVLAYHTEAGGK